MNANEFQVGECSCERCQSACTYRPGWFAPEQIAPLAAALGLTPKQFFDQHLQIDWWEADEPIFVLAPRGTGEMGGTMYPSDPRHRCHWFVHGKCEIHAAGKPMECQQSSHIHSSEQVAAMHKAVFERWRPAEHQQMIRDLYEGEPEAEEFYGGGPFGLLGSILRGE